MLGPPLHHNKKKHLARQQLSNNTNHDNSPSLWKRVGELAPQLVIQGQQGRVRNVTQGHLKAEILESLQQSWISDNLVKPAHLFLDSKGVFASIVQASWSCGTHLMVPRTAGQLDCLQ